MANDRVMVQVRFRKAIWKCSCGQVDYTDLNMDGMNTYEHNCSVCGKWSNKFTNYSGCATYAKDEYEALKVGEVDIKKQADAEKFQYDKEHPPVYVEPTKEELEQELASKQAEVDELQIKIDAKLEVVEER